MVPGIRTQLDSGDRQVPSLAKQSLTAVSLSMYLTPTSLFSNLNYHCACLPYTDSRSLWSSHSACIAARDHAHRWCPICGTSDGSNILGSLSGSWNMLTWADLSLRYAFVNELKLVQRNLQAPDLMRAWSYRVPDMQSVLALYLVETS
jgi:hypothetical protein